jgi:hypothetical protein
MSQNKIIGVILFFIGIYYVYDIYMEQFAEGQKLHQAELVIKNAEGNQISSINSLVIDNLAKRKELSDHLSNIEITKSYYVIYSQEIGIRLLIKNEGAKFDVVFLGPKGKVRNIYYHDEENLAKDEYIINSVVPIKSALILSQDYIERLGITEDSVITMR